MPAGHRINMMLAFQSSSLALEPRRWVRGVLAEEVRWPALPSRSAGQLLKFFN